MTSNIPTEPAAPKVTFGNYVVPETVQEYTPPPPADPVHFAPEPAPKGDRLETPFGKAELRFDPDLIGKGILVLVVFLVAALVSYFFSRGGSAEVAANALPAPHTLSQIQNGPRLISPA